MNQSFINSAMIVAIDNVKSNKGGPFGCVITKNDTIIGIGSNKVTTLNDPTAHAEVCAIREACKTVGHFSLEGCVMYTSCEPCPMCLSAIYWARIKKVYYCNTRHDANSIGFDDAFIYDEFKKENKDKSIELTRIDSPFKDKPFSLWNKSKQKTKY